MYEMSEDVWRLRAVTRTNISTFHYILTYPSTNKTFESFYWNLIDQLSKATLFKSLLSWLAAEVCWLLKSITEYWLKYPRTSMYVVRKIIWDF